MVDPVEAHGGHAEFPVRVHPPQPGQFGVVGRHPTLEHLLGQRRPIVGLVRLVTDDGQRACETHFPQRFGGAQTGQ